MRLPDSAVPIVPAWHDRGLDLEGLVFRRAFSMQKVVGVSMVQAQAGGEGMASLNKRACFQKGICAAVILPTTLPLYFFKIIVKMIFVGNDNTAMPVWIWKLWIAYTISREGAELGHIPCWNTDAPWLHTSASPK